MRPLVPVALLVLALPHLLVGATLYVAPRWFRTAGFIVVQPSPTATTALATGAMVLLSLALGIALFQRRIPGLVVAVLCGLLFVGFTLWGAATATEIARFDPGEGVPTWPLQVSLLGGAGTHAAMTAVVGVAALRLRILTTLGALAVPLFGMVGMWGRVQANQGLWGVSWIWDPVSVMQLAYQGTAWMALLALLIAVWAPRPDSGRPE